MSEFQYYEFYSIDQMISDADQAFLQKISSRAKINSRQAIFTFSYRDFPHEAVDVLDRCFDMMVYMANFGIRQLMIRFAIGEIDPAQFEPYLVENLITVQTTAKSVILNFEICHEDYYDWLAEEHDDLGKMLNLRDDILNGDLRSLYLVWLSTADAESIDLFPQLRTEPPVPANLQKLSPALKHLNDFFQIDPDWVKIAAQASATLDPKTQPTPQWAEAIAALPEAERNAYLLRVLEGDSSVRADLRQRVRSPQTTPTFPGITPGTRRLSEIITAAEDYRKQLKAQATAAAHQKRQQYLATMVASRTEPLWAMVEDLVREKRTKAYEQAIIHLVDLRDCAKNQGKIAEFRAALQSLQNRYPTLRGFHDRVRQAGLL